MSPSIRGWPGQTATTRAELKVWVRQKVHSRGRCGRCGNLCAWEDNGGGERTWRHLDVGYATTTLVAVARRVNCPACGLTVAQVHWARHDSAFTWAFEDLVVYDAIASSKQRAAARRGVSWRAVNHACIRVTTEALGRVDLLAGLSAIAIDEVKCKQGQRYLTVICNHMTGKVVWAAEGRSKETLGKFFEAMGAEHAAHLRFVTADGVGWIHDVVAEKADQAIVCLDTFHVVKWATGAVDVTRRTEWNSLRRAGSANAAKEVKGLRWLLLRNWESLSRSQRRQLKDLEMANRRIHRAWRLKEELRDVFKEGIIAGRRALDRWLAAASRSKLEAFVKLARTIRAMREKIESTIRYGPVRSTRGAKHPGGEGHRRGPGGSPPNQGSQEHRSSAPIPRQHHRRRCAHALDGPGRSLRAARSRKGWRPRVQRRAEVPLHPLLLAPSTLATHWPLAVAWQAAHRRPPCRLFGRRPPKAAEDPLIRCGICRVQQGRARLSERASNWRLSALSRCRGARRCQQEPWRGVRVPWGQVVSACQVGRSPDALHQRHPPIECLSFRATEERGIFAGRLCPAVRRAWVNYGPSWENTGAGDGNRTRVLSLGS
jgi:transposase